MLTPLAANAEVILARWPGRFCPQTVICFAAIDSSARESCRSPGPGKTRLCYQIAGERSGNSRRSRPSTLAICQLPPHSLSYGGWEIEGGNDAPCRRSARAGLRAQGPNSAGCEALRLPGQKKSSPCLLSARLEPDLYQRRRLLRQRYETVREA